MIILNDGCNFLLNVDFTGPYTITTTGPQGSSIISQIPVEKINEPVNQEERLETV